MYLWTFGPSNKSVVVLTSIRRYMDIIRINITHESKNPVPFWNLCFHIWKVLNLVFYKENSYFEITLIKRDMNNLRVIYAYNLLQSPDTASELHDSNPLCF